VKNWGCGVKKMIESMSMCSKHVGSVLSGLVASCRWTRMRVVRVEWFRSNVGRWELRDWTGMPRDWGGEGVWGGG